MKNTLIRAFVVALALTGAVSTVHANSKNAMMAAESTNLPIPTCPPNDPNGCGIR